jgi:hypothetical protein
MPKFNDGGFLGKTERQYLEALLGMPGSFEGHVRRGQKKLDTDIRRKLASYGRYLKTFLSDTRLIVPFRSDPTVRRNKTWDDVRDELRDVRELDLMIFWHVVLPRAIKRKFLRWGTVADDIEYASVLGPQAESLRPNEVFELLQESVQSFRFADQRLERRRQQAESALCEIRRELARLHESGHSFEPDEGFLVAPEGIVIDPLPARLAQPLREFRSVNESTRPSRIELPFKSGPRRLMVHIPLAGYSMRVLSDEVDRTFREIYRDVVEQIEKDFLWFLRTYFDRELDEPGIESARARLLARFWERTTSRRRRKRPPRGGYRSALSRALRRLNEIGLVRQTDGRYEITELARELVMQDGLIFDTPTIRVDWTIKPVRVNLKI